MKSGAGSREKGSSGSGKTRHKGHPRPKNMGLNARIEKLQRTLASAAWEAYGEMFGYGENHGRPFSLELSVVIEPGQPWLLKADPPIEEQIRDAVRDMATQAEAVKSGSVYCYHCESSECPHSVPPRPSSVFGGYSATGLPRWPELAQVLLELRHPNVDMLYQSSGKDLAAAYMDADHLKGQQLNIFGKLSKTYDILGQIVFGFLQLKPSGERMNELNRVAFTVQAVETRSLDGSPRLELNVLARLWDGTPAIDALDGPYQMRILKLITDTRRRIHQLSPSTRSAGKRRPARLKTEVPKRTAHILQEMARSLERIGRQTGRRTIHAEERRVNNRPTSKAWEDAASAPLDHILWDVHRHTVVVLGPRNRVHIFSPQGRHVTTLLLEAEATRSRLRRRRWRPLVGETLEQFSAAVGRSDAGTTTAADGPVSNQGPPDQDGGL